MKWIHSPFPQRGEQIAAAIYQQTRVKRPQSEEVEEASHQRR